MNTDKLKSKVGGALYLAIALLLLSQQHALQRSHANERAADQELMRMSLEMAALKSQQPNLWREVVP